MGGHAPPATPTVALLGGLTSEADLMALAQQQAGRDRQHSARLGEIEALRAQIREGEQVDSP